MLPKWYGEYKNFIEDKINYHIDEYLDKSMSKPLEEFKKVIKYSIKGGKKIRAIFALEFYLVLSGKKISEIGNNDDIIKFCLALEFVHAYSLVHDDLPCIDNDDIRRSEPTVWKKFSENDAVLVGDLLNTLSFELLSDISSGESALMLIKLLSSSIGFYGMLGGQVEDLYFEKHEKELNLDILKKLHAKKTGALIKASILGGVLLSEKLDDFDKFAKFSDNIGLAFQIKDDILDVEGDPNDTGKNKRGEEKGYVHFLGMEKSKKMLGELIEDSLIQISNLKDEKLNFITNYIGNRNK